MPTGSCGRFLFGRFATPHAPRSMFVPMLCAASMAEQLALSDYKTPAARRIRQRILTQRFRGAGAVLFAARRGAATTSRPPLLVATACLVPAAAASTAALTRTW